MTIPMTMNPMGRSSGEPYFSLVVKPGILGDMEYGFTPYWNTGGYCKVLDWGDGIAEDAVKSGTVLTHTYSVAGTYKIKIVADCWRLIFGNKPAYYPLVYDSNAQWDFLGDLTEMGSMFQNCSNAIYHMDLLPPHVTNMTYAFMNNNHADLRFRKFPEGVVAAQATFSGCSRSPLAFTSLPKAPDITQIFYYNLSSSVNIIEIPEECVILTSVFSSCKGPNCSINIKKLPDNVKDLNGAFAQSDKTFIDISELAANAPTEGWTKLTILGSAFYKSTNVTGSRSAFLAKCPNVTNITNAFEGTSTVAGDDAFELVVAPTSDSLTYGFTPYWNTGGWCYVADWGDGSTTTATTSGMVLTHTYKTAGTYTIKIIGRLYRCVFGNDTTYAPLVLDCNAAWWALGNIINGRYMFYNCTNATLSLTSLPAGLTNATGMFNSCKKATFPFTSLPDGITNGSYMFYNCTNATLPLTSLPDGLTNADSMFGGCSNAQLSLTSLPAGLTNGYYMFSGCSNAQLPLTSLPAGLTNATGMFNSCKKATFPFTSLPDGLTNATGMFSSCTNATLPLTSLPDGLTNAASMFSGCKKAVINLDNLTANAPEEGWTEVTNIENMFYHAGSGNSPGTVTGSRSAFLAKFPNATKTTNAFYGTNTTE